MELARAREAERKADTRHKIQLGGLVIKAGFGDVDEAVILGALLDAAKRLNGPDGLYEKQRFVALGNDALNAKN
ncbi:conjugal transfer protein TraD [Escherichia coli]|nr:conjugal transfer protein TraD [Escherichia coli]SQU01425.1 conjugal transfer protein TraD [Escherichia coli]SQU05711.1 conjugal transfer protein TraD [Escherichia coli]SQU29269.1 conjugal transfer protein TraD [Escherichia coli]SQU30127.1 conjugal transfer protein TraD [Escherichia coli]SQU74989.1 conjugal transfer protein TraD [Escherichia coli]